MSVADLVLIVEDHAPIESRLRMMVGELVAESRVRVAHSSEAVHQALMGQCPVLCVLDLDLRNGTGMATLERFSKEFPGVPVIVITNHAQPQYANRCLASGAQHVLDKTRDIEALPKVIEAALRKGPQPSASAQQRDTPVRGWPPWGRILERLFTTKVL